MDFFKIKNNIDTYINNLYRSTKKDIDGINKYSSLDRVMQLEEKKINNYSISVRESIVNDVEQSILQNMGIKSAEKFSKKYKFESPHFKKIQLREDDIYRIRTIKKSVEIDDKHSNDNNELMYILGTGAIAGVALGVVTERISLGAIGAIAGGILGKIINNSLNKDNNTPSKKVVEKQIKELDKDKIINILEKRQNEVRQSLIHYVENIENAFREFSRGC